MKSLKVGYSHLNFHEMPADSDLNFHKKLMRFEYSQLYFHKSKISRKICENIVPQKLDYMVLCSDTLYNCHANSKLATTKQPELKDHKERLGLTHTIITLYMEQFGF